MVLEIFSLKGETNLKKNKIISSIIIIILLISISSYYFLIIYPNQKTDDWEEITIYNNNENSVYNGNTQSELAEYLAEVLNVTPLISKEMEPHHGTTWYRFYYKNNTTVIIVLNDGRFWNPMGRPFEVRSKKELGINITEDPLRAGEIIFDIWKNYLGYLNYQLEENDYNLSIESHGPSSWKVIIRQICNNNISLKNTGMVGIIGKENSRIRDLWINDWSIIKIQKPISISFENAKNLICNETLNFTIDRKLLNFSGYFYRSGSVYYTFEYKELIDNDEYNYLQYDFYLDAVNGELEYNQAHVMIISSKISSPN
jgi:hypothetical protein